jgi:hypothetical protein
MNNRNCYLRLSLILFLFVASAIADAKTTYVLGVDGLSYESFKLAQAKGHFKEFKYVGAHIAPFPSMTDLSWNTITRTTEVFGTAGRIGSVEAVYFNESRKAVEGDVRDVYRRMAQPKLYLNAFQNVFNPYVEALMYFPTRELARLEQSTVLKDMAAPTDKSIVTGYVGGVDSTAHTQLDRLYPVLEILDKHLSDFIKTKKSNGEDLEVILMSDHGNVGAFAEGQKELELNSVELEPVLKSLGLNFVQQLNDDNDVAMPLMALGSWAPVYLKNRANAEKIIEGFSKYEWFDFGVRVLEKSPQKVVIYVAGSRGKARVTYFKNEKTYVYESLGGNPLDIPQGAWNHSLNISQVEQVTRQGAYPDSLIRLAKAADSDQFDFPDMILTLKDGYYINNALGKMTKMYRTHGSLSRLSSLGLVASTSRAVPEYLRSEQILQYFQIKPETLFGKIANITAHSGAEAVKEARASQGIPTGYQDFSQKRIFQQMTKVIATSRPYFVMDEITDFMKSVTVLKDQKNMPMQIQGLNTQDLDAKPIIDPTEIGELTDIVIQNPDVILLQKNPKIISMQKKFGNIDSDITSQKGNALAVKRAVMKLYQVPYLLDQSLVIQEKPKIPDTRDLSFADYWLKNADALKITANRLMPEGFVVPSWIPWKKSDIKPTIPQRLFQEIFKEKVLEDRIFPEPMETIYKSSPQKATIVYVPGTYNGIFDREIFSLGLLSLQEDMGLRVLKVPILSACNSEHNGEMLLNFLKEDQEKFIARKQTPPKYIILGYSKGGVDSLYAFVKDTQFVKNNVLGLAALATPLRGSEVLEKADLPFTLVNMLIDEKTPEICKSEKTIVSTGSSAAMNSFWRRHEKTLTGLTRYFSLAFVSKPEDSHLYMKVTKVIGQFGEDNDGIVSVSSTKFPAALSAVDLGVVEGDHLAGILSSRFPQKAFMRALVTTLAELGIEKESISEDWKLQSILKSTPTKIENKYSHDVNPYSKTVVLREYNQKGHPVSMKEYTFKDAYDLNKILLGWIKDPAASYEPKVKLPPNQLNFDPYTALDVSKLVDILSAKKVVPATPQTYKSGLDLSFNHKNFLHYRLDHQFSYENRSPVGADNNPKWGFESVMGPDKTPWLALRSEKNSIRLTTLAYRFKVSDFSRMLLDLKVTQGPTGADPVKGRSGKDDSAFQVWFTLRDLRGVTDRSIVNKNTPKVYFFGYYWGEETPNENRVAGQMFENYYSNKNVVVTTLPESYEVVINNGKADLGKIVKVDQDIAADIKKAFPNLDVNQLEVVAITYQMDSNDTGTKSEAFMKTLKFVPTLTNEL